MLTKLILKNLILVETCEIPFKEGFNVISGETGAGKTALVEAISLILGERADHSKIRLGTDHAQVQAFFELDLHSPVYHLLQEAAITCYPEEELIIQRDLLRLGKTKALINQQPVSLALLQQIAPYLIDHVGQHAHVSLKETTLQRQIIDLFAELKDPLHRFLELNRLEKEKKQLLDQLIEKNNSKTAELEKLALQQEEIFQLHLQTDEDTLLFQEYQKLSHMIELKTYAMEMIQLMQERIFPLMNQFQKPLNRLIEKDPSLEKHKSSFKEAICHLEELLFDLNHYYDGLEDQPKRLQYIDERLKLIDDLKKKYHKSVNELLDFQEEMKQQTAFLTDLENHLISDKKRHAEILTKLSEISQVISGKRKKAATLCETEVMHVLHELNMPHAELRIHISPTSRTQFGEDEIQFFMKPNKGESLLPIKDIASGGELARLLFALKVVLAQKNPSSTLIFDEIDSNVGGETARIIGEKLAALGKYRQVLCITHFPQVASCADHHLRVYKMDHADRTIAVIEALDQQGKKKELERMLGGKELDVFS